MSRLAFWRRASRASNWFERIRAGRIDKHTDGEFTRWMADDARNGQALEVRELVWNLSGELRGRPSFEHMLREAGSAGTPALTPASVWPWPRWLVAGAALLMLATGALWLGLQTRGPDAIEYVTGMGEQREVTLSDGSTVTLNTDTRILARMSDQLRRIELSRGEALFSVQHDAGAPFEVHVPGGHARAVGTQFNVYLMKDSAEISVLEGIVETTTRAGLANGQTTRLVANQTILIDATGEQSEIREANRNRILGWQQQRIVLRNVTVADALAEYSRYGGTPFVLEAEGLADLRVSGNFRIGDEEAFIGALERGLPLQAERTGSQVILRMREP